MKPANSVVRLKISFFVVLLAIIFVFSSCITMSTMQTARVTEKGKFSTGIGFVLMNAGVSSPGISILDLEVGTRYGVTDRMDVGARISSMGAASTDAKYQFLGDKKSVFAGSAGLAVEYLYSVRANSYDLVLPVYFSYHPLDWLSIYGSPKYFLKYVYTYDLYHNTNSNTFSHWYGTTGGIRLGRRIAFIAEYSYFRTNVLSEPYTLITAGICIGFK